MITLRLVRPLSNIRNCCAAPRRFCGKRSLHQPKQIPFNIADQLIGEWKEVSQNVRKHGYVVLTPASSNHQVLLDTCRLFGAIQNHSRAVKDGIVDIRSNSLATKGNHVISDIAFDPHSDGAYLDGIAMKDGMAYRIVPPKIIAVQCIKPSLRGGISFLVDGEAILSTVVREHPELLTMLFSRSAMSICRGQQLVVNCPVFSHLPSGNIMMRYSYDRDLYIAEWARAAMQFFHQNYVLNPKFTTYHHLVDRQILIVDNHRLLHGRTEIKGDRLFRRVWIQDEDRSVSMVSPKLENEDYYESTGNGSDQTSLEKYRHYLPVTLSQMANHPKKIPVGIRLQNRLLEAVQRALHDQRFS